MATVITTSRDSASSISKKSSMRRRHCSLMLYPAHTTRSSQVGVRKPGDRSHSLIWAATSFRRARFIKASRSAQGGSLCARSRAHLLSAARRSSRVCVCLNRMRRLIIAALPPNMRKGAGAGALTRFPTAIPNTVRALVEQSRTNKQTCQSYAGHSACVISFWRQRPTQTNTNEASFTHIEQLHCPAAS